LQIADFATQSTVVGRRSSVPNTQSSADSAIVPYV
jgi:hypothetical protein